MDLITTRMAETFLPAHGGVLRLRHSQSRDALKPKLDAAIEKASALHKVRNFFYFWLSRHFFQPSSYKRMLASKGIRLQRRSRGGSLFPVDITRPAWLIMQTMKTFVISLTVGLATLASLIASAQLATNVTVTNLQGKVYRNITLDHTNALGVVWVSPDGTVGQFRYADLSLESWKQLNLPDDVSNSIVAVVSKKIAAAAAAEAEKIENSGKQKLPKKKRTERKLKWRNRLKLPKRKRTGCKLRF